jgi:hypothetical protein
MTTFVLVPGAGGDAVYWQWLLPARERLGREVDVLPGGHLLALAQPERLADYLVE